MDFLLNRYRNLTVLLVVIIGQLLLLAYQVKNNQDVRVIRVWAVSVVTPMARVLEFVRRNTIGIAEDYFVLVNVRDENVRLQKENGQLKMQNQYLRNELSTADRVKALRAFQEHTPSKTLAARVIGNGTGANSQVVFIDRGSGSGIVKGMPVVTPDGIVGKVLAAYPTASQVLLATDANFAAGVESQKNHVRGTLVGLGGQSKCAVKYVQNEEKVEPGEMFYTSGDDRVFPKGMPAGKATVVRQGRDFKEIYVEPSGWNGGLEEVLVVLEGVHQDIPEVVAQTPGPVHMQAPPPESKQEKAEDSDENLSTEADHLRDKYKRIGDAQGHKFGEGSLGTKPPDFNLDPDAAAKAAAARAAAAKAAAANAAAGVTAGSQTGTPPVRPPTAAPAQNAGNPAAGTVKPPAAAAGAPRTPATPGAAAGQTRPPANAAAVAPGTVMDGNGRIILKPNNPKPNTATAPANPATGAAAKPVVPKPAPKLDANGNPLPVKPKPAPAITEDRSTINVVTPAPRQAAPKQNSDQNP